MVNIPVVAASGAGKPEDVLSVIKEANPSGVAISSLLHYDITTVLDLKKYLQDNGVEVAL
jgi:cyclase